MSQVVAGIKGTTFILEETGNSSTLKVLEGIVNLKSKSKSIDVTSGNMAKTDPTGDIKTGSIDIAKEAQ